MKPSPSKLLTVARVMPAALLLWAAGVSPLAAVPEEGAVTGAVAATAEVVTVASGSVRLESNGLRVLDAMALQHENTLRLVLFVQNVGDTELTVATANIPVTIEGGDIPVYQLALNSTMKFKGVPLIPSIYRFNPVTLRPGEGAEIRVDYLLRKKRSVVGGVVIGYSVSDAIADRLGLWKGTLLSEPIQVRHMQATNRFANTFQPLGY